MENSIKNETIKSVAWSAIERFSVQAFQFLFSIVLARLVSPGEFGLIAMLSVFIVIAQSLVESGFSNALIQKLNRTEEDYSTVFYFNIAIAVVIYMCLFFSASSIASFYNEPLLKVICQWFGLVIFFQSFSVVQIAKLTIKLDFKTQAKASLISVIIGGIVGITLAFYNYGVWALLIQTLLSSFINTSLLWVFSKWVPSSSFSWVSLKNLFSFGSKLLLSGLLHTIYVNLYSLVIGRKFSSVEVGFFNQSNQISRFPSVSLMAIISRAVYPIQCKIQDQSDLLRDSFKQYLRMACYIIFPIMVSIAVMSKQLITVLLTEKWLPMASSLTILSISYMWIPLMVVNNQILTVRGRSDYFLKAELIKKVFGVLILVLTIPFGMTWICLGIFFYNLCDVVIIVFFSKKVIETNFVSQIKSIFPILILSLSMSIVIYLVMLLSVNVYIQILYGSLAAITFYYLVSSLCKIPEFTFIQSTVFKLLNNKQV